MSLSNLYVEVLTLVPPNGVLFGNNVAADVIGYDEVMQEEGGPIQQD